MAIPFLQPEEDESARHHGANGPNTASAHAGVGAGAGSSGTGSASASGSGAVVVGGAGSSGGAVMLAGATGPMPVPNSPAAPIISSGTSTAVQTPLIGPMNSDQLVQLFYEALYRYSRGGTYPDAISENRHRHR